MTEQKKSCGVVWKMFTSGFFLAKGAYIYSPRRVLEVFFLNTFGRILFYIGLLCNETKALNFCAYKQLIFSL